MRNDTISNQYIYSEYVFDGFKTKRNNILSIHDFQFNEKQVDCYNSVFLFDEDFKSYVLTTGSVTGYKGKHYSHYLPFDFDGNKDGSNIDLVRLEVIKFCIYLQEMFSISTEHLRLFFSGGRGFHLLIPIQYFGEIIPSVFFADICKGMAKDLANEFKYLDDSLYQTVHVIRLNGSINSKTGLYKIPLTFEELNSLSITQIMELAKGPIVSDYLDPNGIIVSTSCEELYKKWSQHSFTTVPVQKEESKEGAKYSFQELLKGVSNNRNSAAIKICGYFIKKDLEESYALSIIQGWNKLNRPPLSENEIETIVSGAYRRYNKDDNSFSMNDVFDFRSAAEQYLEIMKNQDKRKVTIGLPTIDTKMRGILPGETVCIQGKTGVGKSAFMQNIGHHNARFSGEPVLIFSLEMPMSSVFERGMQIECGLAGQEVEDIFKTNDNAVPEQAKMLFNKLPNLYTIVKTGLTLEKIRKWIEFAEENVYHKKTGLVLIDYLGLLKSKGNNPYEQMSMVARGMKDLAKELSVPIIFLSQVTKSKTEYEPLGLNSTRDSGSIPESSDHVLSLWKNENNSDLDNDKLFVGIDKNRKGGTGNIPVLMRRKTLEFEEDFSIQDLQMSLKQDKQKAKEK